MQIFYFSIEVLFVFLILLFKRLWNSIIFKNIFNSLKVKQKILKLILNSFVGLVCVPKGLSQLFLFTSFRCNQAYPQQEQKQYFELIRYANMYLIFFIIFYNFCCKKKHDFFPFGEISSSKNRNIYFHSIFFSSLLLFLNIFFFCFI